MRTWLSILFLLWALPAFAAPKNTGNYPSSGVAPLTGTFAGTGVSTPFAPLTGRGFSLVLQGTFVATVVLEYSFDGGTTWVAGQYLAFTTPDVEIYEVDEVGVLLRWNCTSWTSGTVTYRISQ